MIVIYIYYIGTFTHPVKWYRCSISTGGSARATTLTSLCIYCSAHWNDIIILLNIKYYIVLVSYRFSPNSFFVVYLYRFGAFVDPSYNTAASRSSRCMLYYYMQFFRSSSWRSIAFLKCTSQHRTVRLFSRRVRCSVPVSDRKSMYALSYYTYKCIKQTSLSSSWNLFMSAIACCTTGILKFFFWNFILGHPVFVNNDAAFEFKLAAAVTSDVRKTRKLVT